MDQMMMPSTESSSSQTTPTTIMDLPSECLTLIFKSLDCLDDHEAFGLTCHSWLSIQNLNRQCLHIESQNQQLLAITPVYLHRLLTRFPNLTSLSLFFCKTLTDSIIEDIQQCLSSLKLLQLNLACCTGITENGIALFCRACPFLKFIDLHQCDVTDNCLESISEFCSDLDDITLTCCPRITDYGINKLVITCGKLYGMRLSHSPDVTGTGFQGCSQTLAYIEMTDSCNMSLEGMKCMLSGGGLEYLDIWYQPISGDYFSVIGQGGFGGRLRFLKMIDCRSAGDESIAAIAMGCPLLEEWNLALCEGVQLYGWEAIGENCNCLVKLAVYRCTNICNDGLTALMNGCERLKVLYIRRCPLVDARVIELFQISRGDVEISEEMWIGPKWESLW